MFAQYYQKLKAKIQKAARQLRLDPRGQFSWRGVLRAAFCVTFEMEDGTVFQVKQFCVGEAYDFFSIVPKVIPDGKDFYGWMLKNNENVVFGKGSWAMEENITVVPLFKDEQSYSPIY